jgi:hypothetical protein
MLTLDLIKTKEYTMGRLRVQILTFKRKRVLKSKRVRNVLRERLDLLSLKEKRLARLPAYLLYLFKRSVFF